MQNFGGDLDASSILPMPNHHLSLSLSISLYLILWLEAILRFLQGSFECLSCRKHCTSECVHVPNTVSQYVYQWSVESCVFAKNSYITIFVLPWRDCGAIVSKWNGNISHKRVSEPTAVIIIIIINSAGCNSVCWNISMVYAMDEWLFCMQQIEIARDLANVRHSARSHSGHYIILNGIRCTYNGQCHAIKSRTMDNDTHTENAWNNCVWMPRYHFLPT